LSEGVGTPNFTDVSRLNSPARTTPTDTSPPPSRAADARLGAIVDRYSFDVENSHLLLHAGLSRRFPLNRQIRKIIKTRRHFPDQDAARRLLFLAITNAQQTWRTAYNRNSALAAFRIHPGRSHPRHRNLTFTPSHHPE
jgi:hypothetical protein